MSDARFGIQIDANGQVAVTALREVRGEIDQVGAAGKRLNDSTAATTQAQINASYQAQKAAEQYRAQADSMGVASAQVQKLLDRYDPLGTKLRALQSDFAMLNKAASGGELGKSSDLAVDKTYKALNEEIAKTKQLMAAAGAATEDGASSMSKLGLNTQYARRELMTLGREALTGDFSRMPLTFGSLLTHSNLLALALNPVTLAIVALIVATVTYASAAAAGHKEMAEMNNALAVTSNYAGTTRGAMRELSLEMANQGTVTVGTSKQIVTALVSSGQVGAQAMGTVARLASDYAHATGRDIDKIAPELVKLFADPAKGAAELNQQMHFLSVADMERIQHLQRTGEAQAAQQVLAEKLDAFLPKHAQNLGLIERAWNAVKGAASGAWDAAAGVGRKATMEELLKQAEDRLAKAGGSHQAEGAQSPELAAARDRVTKLREAKDLMDGMAAAEARMADRNKTQNEAAALTNQVSAYAQIKKLREDAVLIGKLDAQSDEQKLAKADALRKINREIFDAERSIGAEGRELAQGRIADATKLYEVQKGSSAEEANTQLKLGVITKKQHDDWLLWLDLADIARKKLDAEAVLRLGGLSKLQKQSLTDQIALYDAMAQARKDKGINDDLLQRNALLVLQADADAKASQATTDAQLKAIAGYDAEIEKLKLHNAEIGKTKEQVDLLKAAETERAILQIQNDIYSAASDANGSAAGAHYIALQEAKIARLKEILQLQTSGAALDAQDAANKRQAQDWKTLWTTVERTGKETFNILALGGENMAQRVGKALKSSIADLLYQLTARPFIIQIGTSFAGSLGINTAANAATGIGGANSLLSGGGLLGSLTAGFQGATLAEGLAGPTTAAAGGLTGIGAAMAAIPGWGWAALGAAAIAVYLSSGGGGPKNPDMAVTTSGVGGPAGALAITANNFANGGMSVASYQAINDWLAQLPERLKTAVDGMAVSLSPDATAEQAWAQLQSQINATAASLDLTTEEMAHLGTIAAQTAQTEQDAAAAAAIAGKRHELDIALMEATGNAAGALAARRADELAALDPTLRPLQEQIHAAQDLATAASKARDELDAAATGFGKIVDAIKANIALQTDMRRSANDELASDLASARGAVWTAYDTEAQKLRTLADSMGGFGKSLRELQQSLLLGSNSPLAPMGQLAEAQRQFRDMARRAQLGDQDALAGLSGASQNYLAAGRGAYASGDAYSAIFSEVQAALGGAAGTADRAANQAEQQISALKTQTEQLVGNTEATLSLTDAMLQFTALLTTRNASLAGGAYNAGSALADAKQGIAGGNIRGVYERLIAEGITASQFDTFMGYKAGTSNAWARRQGLPSFAAGTPFVPHDMVANIHRGERITTSASNDALVVAVQGMLSEMKAQRAEIQRLTAIVQAGDTANVRATERIAESQESIARRASLEDRARVTRAA